METHFDLTRVPCEGNDEAAVAPCGNILEKILDILMDPMVVYVDAADLLEQWMRHKGYAFSAQESQEILSILDEFMSDYQDDECSPDISTFSAMVEEAYGWHRSNCDAAG